MNKLSRRVVLEYLIWLVLGVLIVVLVKLFPAIGSISFYFLFSIFYFLFLPGWLLSRLIRIKLDDFIGRWLSYFALSLGFYLIINLLAILLDLNIQTLLICYYIILPLLFIATLTSDLKRPPEHKPIDFKALFVKENLIYLIPIIIAIIIFFTIDTKGADFNGDPAFHLAIIRKAISGGALNPQNLGFTKSASLNPAYAFPAWHIFLAPIAKFLNLNIFTAWSKMILPLFILAVFSWYFFFKNLFQSKSIAVLALILFLIFTFNNGTGYFFQRLTVPDSLSQFILFPLILGLTLKYIFDFKTDRKILIPVGVLAVSLLLIHAIHYFYFILVILGFAIVYAISKFKDKDYHPVIARTIHIILASMVPFALVAIVLELKSQFISKTLQTFSRAPYEPPHYATFDKFEITFKYAYLAIPLIIIFIRKNARLTLLLAMMLLAPLVYWTPLKYPLAKLFSTVFTDRLYGNVSLYFAVIALILGAILLGLDRWWSQFSKMTRDVINGLLVLGLIIIVLLQIHSNAAFTFYRGYIYSYNNRIFIDQYGLIILAVIILVTGGIIVWQVSYPKKEIVLGEFKNIFTGFLLLAIIAFVFLSPTYKDLRNNFSLKSFFLPGDATSKVIYPQDLNYDSNAINFIQTKIPSKSVILADPISTKPLSMLTDQFMAYSLKSGTEKELNSIYRSSTTSDQKKEILFNKYTIDYVFLREPQNQSGSYFVSNPALYIKIYSGQTQIYELVK